MKRSTPTWGPRAIGDYVLNYLPYGNWRLKTARDLGDLKNGSFGFLLIAMLTTPLLEYRKVTSSRLSNLELFVQSENS